MIQSNKQMFIFKHFETEQKQKKTAYLHWIDETG